MTKIKRILLASALATVILWEITFPMSIHAQSLRSKVENGMPHVGGAEVCPAGTGPVSSGGGGGSTTVPEEAIEIFNGVSDLIEQNKPAYEEGAQAANIPWTLLAALHYREATNNPNKSILSGETLGTTNPDNAHLTSDTLEESAVNAANHLKNMAQSVYGVEINETGDHSLEELQQIFVAYNRGFMYEMANASPATSPYAMNYYDANHINMRWPNGPEEPSVTRGKYDGSQGAGRLGAITVYTLLGGGAVGSCGGSADAYVNEDGYAFPVGLPKLDASNGYAVFNGTVAPDPYCPINACHHDETASFDIAHRDTVTGGESDDDKTVGIPVFAITDGVIANFDDTYQDINRNPLPGCHSIQLRSTTDDYVYWYGHIANTIVQKDDVVVAGEQIAEIGPRRCTGNGSYPHLHIDRGSPRGGLGGSVCCRDPGFTEVMNDIYRKWPG